MNEKEKRILREYFKDGPQVLLFCTAFCVISGIYFFVEGNLKNVYFMFFSGCFSWAFGVAWYLVKTFGC